MTSIANALKRNKKAAKTLQSPKPTEVFRGKIENTLENLRKAAIKTEMTEIKPLRYKLTGSDMPMPQKRQAVEQKWRDELITAATASGIQSENSLLMPFWARGETGQ